MKIEQLKTELREFIKLSEAITPRSSISPTMAKCLLVAVETLEAYAEYDELRLKGLSNILAIWEAAK